MIDFSILLDKFSRSLNKDKFLKETTISIIQEYTHIILQDNQIVLKEGILEITANPIIKNEINLKEERIKESLRAHNIYINRILYK